MRVGVIDLLSMPTSNLLELPYRYLLTKQYASIMPQAVAVWAKQLGHEVFYTTYYGYGDPTRLLPSDLDFLFVSSFTMASPVAYAMARCYQSHGTLTVLGGPHARAFPEDSLRFFDFVVGPCDRQLIEDLLAGSFDRGSRIATNGALDDLPSVQERLPYIKQSVFLRGRRYATTTIPMLASTGCPHSCDFCLDWNNPYHLLPTDRLRADLGYLAKHLPGIKIAFHDPNVASAWDKLLDLFEEIPPRQRSPLILEASLASLKKEERLRRIRDARCVFIGVGIESWAGYSQKAGVGKVEGAAKVPLVVEEMRELAKYVPYLQASFVFGLDVDQGDEPIEATKQFITDAPFVWPAINIPQPFGNTPLYDRWLADGRLLTTMPYYFYQMPYLVTIPKHYEPMAYYQKVIDLIRHVTSLKLLRRRLATTSNRQVQLLHITRTLSIRAALPAFQRTLNAWRQDKEVVAFHHRETAELPAVYERILRRALGRLSPWLTRADLIPLPVG